MKIINKLFCISLNLHYLCKGMENCSLRRGKVILLCRLMLTGCLLWSVAANWPLGDTVCAQQNISHYNQEHLDLLAGLPHNNVNGIFADSQGFIWISTYGGGAVRYDGYTFSKPVSSSTEVASNSCKGFAEDGHHRLWVAYDEVTVVVDMRTMHNVTPTLHPQRSTLNPQPSTLNAPPSTLRLQRPSVKVYCDAKGHLWHVTSDSIFRYTFAEDGSVSHISSCRYRGNTPDVTIADIERNGTVWININNGLFRLSEHGSQLVSKDIAPAMKQLQGLYVTDLLKLGNTVWVATNLGLYAYDQYTNVLTAYRHQATDPNSLSHDYATSLAVSPEGHLLVGTLRGVNTFDEPGNRFTHWNTATPKTPLPSDFVTCLLVRDGQIWIGTETAGIVKLSPQPLLLRNYVHEPDNSGSLSPNPVNAMYVEPEGTLWVGTVEGGLNRLHLTTHQFEHWSLNDLGLKHNTVSVLEPDAHGRLWIGSWGSGVSYIPLLSVERRVLSIDMPPEMATLTNYIGSLAYDKYNDALWIGSNDGVFLYDLRTGTLKDPFEGNREIRGCIGSLIDSKGQLWMGCMSGVCIIDLRSQNFKCQRLRSKLDHPTSPVIDKISCFCETRDGTLWLGSNGYGLYRLSSDLPPRSEMNAQSSKLKAQSSSKEPFTFTVLTTDDGLANNSVKGIVEDDQGRLWITTKNGLPVYDPRTRTFNNYSEADGLLCQNFYWNSAVKGPDGAIWLGSLSGLTEIRGENVEAQYDVHLVFTRLTVDNQEITAADGKHIDADISQASCIRLHESNKSFAIDFSTLTYTSEQQGYYRYRMKGFEDEWTSLNPGEHSVRYTSLKPGTYTLEVEYVVMQSSSSVSIQVEVAPYFWKSWWFLLIVALLLAGLGVWFYRRRIEALRQQEAEKLLMPIRRVLDDSDNPAQLQSRIQNILDNHERLQKSYNRSLEADKEEEMRRNRPFMELATEVMEQHYTDSEFGVTEFCEAIGMSRSLVGRRLNAETGLSTGQFIRSYRLNIAKNLLLRSDSNRNITEIAYKVGFNDPKYFTRCFTKMYGTNPSTYAENLNKDKLST